MASRPLVAPRTLEPLRVVIVEDVPLLVAEMPVPEVPSTLPAISRSKAPLPPLFAMIPVWPLTVVPAAVEIERSVPASFAASIPDPLVPVTSPSAPIVNLPDP